MDVGSCIDRKSGLIEPKMHQHFQPCIDANFNSLGESTYMAPNFYMKLPPGFDQIQINKTNLAEDI